MTISWRTDSDDPSVVLIGETSGQYDRNFTGISRRYIHYTGFGGYHHHVTLSGLKPATKYFYIAGSGPWPPSSAGLQGTDGWSSEHNFVTANPGLKTFNVSIVGDWGFGERSWVPSTMSLADQIRASSSSEKNCGYATKLSLDKMYPDIDFTWLLGDIAYADDAFITEEGSLFHFKYEAIYDAFMEWASELSAEKPLMVLPGNHETECHSPACIAQSALRGHLANFTAYQARWQMPSKESGGVLNMWYSFDYGNVHFISMNSETDFDNAPEQGAGAGIKNLLDGSTHVFDSGYFAPNGTYRQWLINDLKKAHANRAERPWIVAAGHRPALEGNGTVNTPSWSDLILDIMEEYEVDLYLAGHVHGYLRTKPGKGNTRKFPKAYVTTGGAGNVEMDICPKNWLNGAPVEFSNLTCQGYPEACPNPEAPRDVSDSAPYPGPWETFEDYGSGKGHYGTVMLRIHNDTHMTMDYILSESGEVADSVTVEWDH